METFWSFFAAVAIGGMFALGSIIWALSYKPGASLKHFVMSVVGSLGIVPLASLITLLAIYQTNHGAAWVFAGIMGAAIIVALIYLEAVSYAHRWQL